MDRTTCDCLARKYLNEAINFVENTGCEPDKKFLQCVEKAGGVGDSEDFRRDVLMKLGARYHQGHPFVWNFHEVLTKCVESLVISEADEIEEEEEESEKRIQIPTHKIDHLLNKRRHFSNT